MARSESDFVCFDISEPLPKLRTAPSDRAWMDATPHRFAYRCLPLTMANTLGWEYLSPISFEAVWDGGAELAAVRVHANSPQGFVVSHFGSGILTLQLNGLFRTGAGVSLFVTGPINRPKDAIAPLTGLVETDWSPFTFTMNWKFTRPNTIVAFERGEPIATIFPLDVMALENIQPVQRSLSTDQQLLASYREWSDSRNSFNTQLKEQVPEAVAEKWQKHYQQGIHIDGSHSAATHRTKLRLKPFVK